MTPKKLISLLLALAALSSPASAEWKEKVLYSFQGGSDGFQPAGGVVFDKSGNLYGATSWGGTICPSPGCGVVFEVSPPSTKGGAWTETAIYVFKGVQGGLGDGLTPVGGLIIDQQGNLYGTTSLGGSGPCVLLGSPAGCGTVYKLSPPAKKGQPWKETILHNFQGGTDGYFPWGDLVFDKNGNLYGATQFGGGKGTTCNQFYGGNCGTVFKLSAPAKKSGKWKEKVLHRFAGGTDGATPNGGMVLDSKGTIYGTTYIGGYNCPHNSGNGCGTVFKLVPPGTKGDQWTEKILHRFKANTDGANPAAGMTFDGKGYLYGTSDITLFRMTPPKTGSGPWKQTILYTLNNDAYDPKGALIFDTNGNLYGTTYSSNTFYGTLFRLKPPDQGGSNWKLAILHGFAGPPDGGQPAATLIFDKLGNRYGTTQNGGAGLCSFTGCGTVFEVSP
jgi:hypothetical protein